MSKTVLVFVDSFSPLQSGGFLPAAARELKGIEVQFVTVGGLSTGSLQARRECQADVHGLETRGSSLAGFLALRKLARNLAPRLVVNWCGPQWVDWAWSRQTRFQAAAPSLAMARQRLVRAPGKRIPELVFAPYPVGNVDGLDSLPMERIRLFRSGLPVIKESTDGSRRSIRQRLGISDDGCLAVTAAKLVPESNLKDLIWATDLLCCVRDDFHLAIVGTGPQQARLERFARLTEAASHVHFVGEVDDAGSLIAGADVYWQSSAGLAGRKAVMTAMSAGVPVITVGHPLFNDLLLHLSTGFVVPLRSRDGFARWTQFLAEQAHQKKQLTDQARTVVMKSPDANSDLVAILEQAWQ